MAAIHPYVQIVHLFLAIVFLGYLFCDVFLITAIKYKLGDEAYMKAKSAISSKAFKIMPVCVFLLILTGGMMMSMYVSSSAGWFESSLQKMFWVKIILAFIIFGGVCLNLFCKFRKKPTYSFMKGFHKFALLCGFLIVLFAKLMFLI